MDLLEFAKKLEHEYVGEVMPVIDLINIIYGYQNDYGMQFDIEIEVGDMYDEDVGVSPMSMNMTFYDPEEFYTVDELPDDIANDVHGYIYDIGIDQETEALCISISLDGMTEEELQAEEDYYRSLMDDDDIDEI